MEKVFADTGYWIALLNSRDSLHSKAATPSREYLSHQIVTTEMVLTEFLNSFCDYGPQLRRAAAAAVNSLRNFRSVIIVPQSSELFTRSLQRYAGVEDKSWSRLTAQAS